MLPTIAVAVILAFAKRPESPGPFSGGSVARLGWAGDGSSLPKCSEAIKVNVTTFNSDLCVPAGGGTVEYTATVCSADGEIEYTSAKALDIRGELTDCESCCEWDWRTHAAPETYTGGCGVRPTIVNLPTACSGDPTPFFLGTSEPPCAGPTEWCDWFDDNCCDGYYCLSPEPDGGQCKPL